MNTARASAAANGTARKAFDFPTLFMYGSFVAAAAALVYSGSLMLAPPPNSGVEVLPVSPFQGDRAFGYLKQICDLGPRPTGSPGMAKQQAFLTDHFTKLGGKVSRQEVEIRHPVTGAAVTVANLLVEFHADRKERVLLCAHYDTRPFPDRDPRRPAGVFLGANDGGSGTALLCEMAHHMKGLDCKYGVDFVLFDAEEFVFDNVRDPYFVGSEHFARDYAAKPPAHTYRWGILFDMVGDAELQLFQEKNSLRWPDTQPLVKEIWALAAELKVREFIARPMHEVRDDHIPLHDIGKIPAIDIIDFDYPRPGINNPFWHTELDRPDKCSARSLEKVGLVVLEWLKRQK